MSQSEFEIVSNITEVCKIVVQVTMFIILWSAVFGIKRAKRDGIVAGLFLFINVGIWLLPCASWVRYAVSAAIATGYSGIFHKKQIGKAFFTMLAFYNFHCLSFLIANSIYMKMTNVWMKSVDGLQACKRAGHNGVAGCYPAFRAKFCGEYDCKYGKQPAYRKNRRRCLPVI